ncbi:MAG: ester cyclase [Dehalococcoidales bacterium]|nr:MAG: ester cyclase [Dehalococcoidales bacterium]
MMSVEKNKEVFHRLTAIFNGGDLSEIPEVIAPDFHYSEPPMEFRGTEGYRQMVTMVRKAFPDIVFTIEELFGEDDKLLAALSWTGTFKGKYGEFEPSGKQITMKEALIVWFKDNKEVKQVAYVDWSSFFQQAGINPFG